MTNKGTVDVVVGGQFGSEAKGHVASIVLLDSIHTPKNFPTACVRVGGPNAGHTVVDEQGKHWAFRQLPVAAVVDETCDLVIAAGSEIDVAVLQQEVETCEQAGFSVRHRLFIDEQATILTDEDIATEKADEMQERIGSTSKGIGAARANRVMRNAHIAAFGFDELEGLGVVGDTQLLLQRILSLGGHVIIEGTQGYGLGLHAGYYPFCTSGDCRAIDCIAQAGINLLPRLHTYLVLRTFPIRVAGNSGPLFEETSWTQLGLETDGYIQPEYTTVTRKVRRVGRFDSRLAEKAIQANRPCHLVLTFVDYLDPALAGCTDFETLTQSPAWVQIQMWEQELGHAFELFTTGPNTHVWRGALANVES